MNIHELRNDTEGCNSVIHFNNAGAALMPKPVAKAIRDYITEEENYGGYEVADRKINELNSFYNHAAKLLNTKPGNIAFTTNATDSYNRALSSIPFKANEVVLLSKNDYPSNFIACLSLQKRFGIKIELVENTATGEIDLEDLEKKIKQFLPKLISVTHVPTSSGIVQPVNEIGNIIKNYDAVFLLDACQSIGQMPVNAAATHADFISGTFRKFLRGPRGAGLLYVSDKALQSGYEPLLPDIRGADWIAENRYKEVNNAKRFEDWETAYALMTGSTAALQYALNLGIEAVEARNTMLNDKLRNDLRTYCNIETLDRGKKQCSIITFKAGNLSMEATKEFFRDKGINIYATSKTSAQIDFEEKNVDWVLRVSPHYYNTAEEIDIFIDAVKTLQSLH